MDYFPPPPLATLHPRCCCMILTHFRLSLHSFHRRRCCRRFLFRRCRHCHSLAAAPTTHLISCATSSSPSSSSSMLFFLWMRFKPMLCLEWQAERWAHSYIHFYFTARLIGPPSSQRTETERTLCRLKSRLHNRTELKSPFAVPHRLDRPVRRRHGFSFSQSAPSFIVSRQIPLYVSRALSLSLSLPLSSARSLSLLSTYRPFPSCSE